MSFLIDIDHAPPRPVVSVPRSVEPVVDLALDEHRLNDPDVFIPGHVPFSDYLQRENVVARYAAASDVFRPDGSGERRPPHTGGQDGADRGPGGWPRLGDVPDVRRTIDRHIEKTYKFERLLPVGTRIDVYH